VTGLGAEAGAALAAHPGVDKIVFTGSTATGQAIARAATVNLKRVSLELGGKSPVIVCKDADMEKAVPVAAMAVFANSGQICIAGSRLFVAREIHDEFVRRVAEFASGLKIGHGIHTDTDIGPIIPPGKRNGLQAILPWGSRKGPQCWPAATRSSVPI
jgi:aldehyde dehydrogenase (NAD+)